MWTDDLAAQFKARRGYDVLKYLPVLVVQGQHQYPVPENDAARRLRPARTASASACATTTCETLTDLYVDNHLRVFQRWARTHGDALPHPGRVRRRARRRPAPRARSPARAACADDESLNAGDPAPLERHATGASRSTTTAAIAGGVHQGGGKEISTELGAMFFRDQQAGLDALQVADGQGVGGRHHAPDHPRLRVPAGRQRVAGARPVQRHRRPELEPDELPAVGACSSALTDYWARGNEVLQQGRRAPTSRSTATASSPPPRRIRRLPPTSRTTSSSPRPASACSPTRRAASAWTTPPRSSRRRCSTASRSSARATRSNTSTRSGCASPGAGPRRPVPEGPALPRAGPRPARAAGRDRGGDRERGRARPRGGLRRRPAGARRAAARTPPRRTRA